MTREEWLINAVYMLDSNLFNGDLNSLDCKFQISVGEVGLNKPYKIYWPPDAKTYSMSTIKKYFPLTIIINHSLKSAHEIFIALAHACIHAFFCEKSAQTKRFKSLAEKYYFETPYKEPHASEYLNTIVNTLIKNMETKFGEWPGKAVNMRL